MGKNIFNSIQLKKPNRNTFDLTHDVKFSSRMGQLVPVMCHEIVPGDKITLGADTLVRFAPIIAPVMHRFDCTIHYFFVPNRIIWDKWEDFITGNADVVAPYFTNSLAAIGDQQERFMDYMGIPNGSELDASVRINALPFAAYAKIYNDYYRDQNLVTEVPIDLVEGDNTGSADFMNEVLKLRLRAYKHDYFTAALPFAQKGAAVDIPLGDVTAKDYTDITRGPLWRTLTNGTVDPTIPGVGQGAVGADINIIDTGDNDPLYLDPGDSLEVGATSINDLRRAFKLQEWLEKNARAGTRYIESILAHFGVRSSDKRLQRPEYITGVRQPVVISEVLNTTGEEGGLPQGNMAGHAVSVGTGKVGSYYAEEHGFVIGIMSVMPLPAYMDLLPKQFLKLDKFDYFWPEFANIGEQEVKNVEIYNKSAFPDQVFGYVPRYSEYKYIPSRVAGEFRTSLDYWHLARKFSSQPGLNQAFIEVDPNETTRIFAVESEDVDNLYCHVLNKVTCSRLMPVYGTPML